MKSSDKFRWSQVEYLSLQIVGVFLIILLSLCTVFTNAGQTAADLSEMSLEDLINIEVTSVSKKAEKLSDAAAAVYVLTGEEIEAVGARTIPDALRTVPGLHVASIDANTWAVSARGFNANLANKLLVLIDGRTVYSPLFSGVWWDVQDVAVDNIDRIEIIRGPGATLWGANAVNGVINIITKNADQQHGGVASVGAGSKDRGFGLIQYNLEINPNTHMRVYGKYFDRDNFLSARGVDAADNWSISRGGLRLDHTVSQENSISIQGDIYDGTTGATYALPDVAPPYLSITSTRTPVSGGNLSGRWTRSTPMGASLTVQAYYDHAERHDKYLDATCRIFDFYMQHSFTPLKDVDMVWGVGYRHAWDNVAPDQYVSLNPARWDYGLANTFVQLDFNVVPNQLELTIGTKVEYNKYTDVELQPNIRMLWQLNRSQSLWAAVSRAVRTPSRGDRDGTIYISALPPLSLANPSTFPFKIEFVGSDRSNSESTIAYEAGYRVRPVNNLSFDLAAFYSDYHNLLSGVIGEPTADENFPSYMIMPISIINARDAYTYGSELAGAWYINDRHYIKVTYGYLWSKNTTDQAQENPLVPSFEVEGPRNQISLFSNSHITDWMQVSARYRYVDKIGSLNIDAYNSIDARVACRLLPNLSIAVVGQDLLETRHEEYRSETARMNSCVERRFYAEARWTF